MKSLFGIDEEKLSSFQIIDWAYTEKLEPITYKKYLKWVKDGHSAHLQYLQDHRKELRHSLKSFFPQAQSSFVFLFSYQAAAKENITDSKIASYTLGFDHLDYHYWIKDKLLDIAKDLGWRQDDFILSIDAQPVLERDLAYRSGLGWFGKNAMLISREHGSFFIIASIIHRDKFDFSPRPIEADHCGHCTRCIDACPTNAIIEDKIIDTNRCISYFTIELFKETPRPVFFESTQSEIFGCDICQDVCPWNTKPLKKVKINKSSDGVLDFFTRDLETIKKELEAMSNREFRRKFRGTALERTGRIGLLKNIKLDS